MGIGSVSPKHLSYKDLRGKADEFLAQYPDLSGPPVDIEKIIDTRIGMEIIPRPTLRANCGVDAFIGRDCQTIYVDDQVYLSPNENRYRFSLAHELAHRILHRSIFERLPNFKTMAEWKACFKEFHQNEQEMAWFEWQADNLAGLLLVPATALKDRYVFLKNTVLQQPDTSDEGVKDEVEIDRIEQELAWEFCVSKPVIEIRCRKDGLHQDQAG